ncbi:MAG: metallophosphoesterase [Acidobacteria bacterium]|nr:metallophosphoesterase [Acidobacteriota bacterium]
MAVFALYSFIEPRWLENKTYIINSPDVPPKFHNLKIAFVSDIHHGPYFDISRVRRLVDKVNLQKPDLILLGGDYVHGSSKYIRPCFNELKALRAPLGVYGVLGNHDHWEGAALTKAEMAASGIVMADNSAFWVAKDGERIKIGGVGDYVEDIQDINPTIGDARKNDFVILLSHNPDYAEDLITDRIDLILSGHNHGGQVTLFGFWAPIVPSRYGQKYRTGLIDLGLAKLIVSNGIGTITPPVRLFARPQIVIAILRRQ